MNTFKADTKTIQSITYEAYKTSGQLLALLDNRDSDTNAIGNALDKMAAQYEHGVVTLRNLCEMNHPGFLEKGAKPTLPHISISGVFVKLKTSQ